MVKIKNKETKKPKTIVVLGWYAYISMKYIVSTNPYLKLIQISVVNTRIKETGNYTNCFIFLYAFTFV